MPLRRVDLPIAGPCPVGVELHPDGSGRSWCERCSKPVHVLAHLRESEVRALLAAHEGRELCVEYRVRPDDSIALRPAPARPLLAAALVGAAACAPLPASPSAMPDETAASDPAQGCPLREPAAPARETTTRTNGAGETVVRVNFVIDPDEHPMVRGMLIGRSDHHRPDRSDRLEWTPTKKLWGDFVARVRERRAARAAR